MNIESAVNRSIALVLWAESEYGEDDVAVFPGVLEERDGAYYLVRESGASPEIRPEWLSRVEEVGDDVRETLCNCDYVLSLSVGEADESHADFESFGLQWPS